jgi:hypothetical protein
MSAPLDARVHVTELIKQIVDQQPAYNKLCYISMLLLLMAPKDQALLQEKLLMY